MWNAVCKLCKVRQQHHEILEQEDFLVGIFPTLKGLGKLRGGKMCSRAVPRGSVASLLGTPPGYPSLGPPGGRGTRNDGGQQTESRTVGEAGTWTPCHDPGPRQHAGSLQLSHPQTELWGHREALPPSHGPSLWDHCLDPHIHWARGDGPR